MKNLIISAIVLLLSFTGHAQSEKIKGTVSDTSGPLAGANVLIKGTATGTQADFNGNFEIAAKPGDILMASYIGYKTKFVTISDASIHLNIILEEDSAVLEEVVVVGYGIKREKKALGYAVSSVGYEHVSGKAAGVSVSNTSPSKSQLKRRKQKAYHESISRRLQGRAAGVKITSAAGAAGAASEFKIREMASSNSTKQPLYIVDGVPIKAVNNPVVANIKPSEIDKVNIYKGTKARQLFGTSAKHGCIVITTKKGNYQVKNDEKYAEIRENKFEHVNLNPLSTFSIDVDKAGYSNVRRMINNGQQIPIDAVKIEEMVNYFDFNYPQPKEHPFSINTEVVKTPWNQETKLVRIGLQGKSFTNEELPASNLTFLIDVSGSMNSTNKLPLLKSAFKLLVNQLRSKDRVSIVVYAGAAGVVLKPTNGDSKEKIITALESLQSGGSTAGGEGIELAYKLAEENFIKKGNNRVILATDGDFNVGPSSDKAMVQIIEEKRKSGVFLSVLGFGMGNYKDSKMEILADKGNGNHAYIDTMQEAQKVFGKEFGGTLYTIAKDVKIQVEFNPQLVKGYRLIGYENRMLADEDFIDDTKDAGELGSGHTVTAIYEIVPKGSNSPFMKKVNHLKYQNTVGVNNNDELFTVKFRYKKPDGNSSIEITKVQPNITEEISEDFSFAASVALFGMHLRKSQYTNESNYNDVITLAEKGIGNDTNGYRSEFIRLVKSHLNLL